MLRKKKRTSPLFSYEMFVTCAEVECCALMAMKLSVLLHLEVMVHKLKTVIAMLLLPLNK